jgi:hypothetical protein
MTSHPSTRPSAEFFAEVMGVIQKTVAGQPGAEPFGETLAELPFIGDQVVCLGHNQAASKRHRA